MINWPVLIPTICYLILVYIIGYYCYRIVAKAPSFLEEYFVGGRQLGGFVLAMTLVATFLSAGSFIGGPGTAYFYGYGWVLLAMTQLPTAYLTLAILGKKFAIVARKIKAVTIVDMFRARYENHAVTILGAVSVIIFLIAAMTAQFIGGATLFQAITGLPYAYGLSLFAITVFVYVAIAGFRGVALTDTLQGIMMFIGTIALFGGAVWLSGGVSNLTQGLCDIDPQLITPFGPNHFISIPWICCFWILVGVGIIGLPYVSIRCMAYKDTKAMHRAMIIGTIVVGWLLLGMHLSGAFARVLVPGLARGDLAIPELTLRVLPPWFAGIFLAGPLAAIMSTVDSQLLLASSAVVKDLYVNYFNPKAKEKLLRRVGMAVTLILGIIIYAAAFKPPTLLIWINLWAIGGLEAAFFFPTVLGLYWKRANGSGALASMIVGIGGFILMSKFWPRPMGFHQILPTLILALIVFIVVSYITPKPSTQILKKFWGK